jgi:hypothetical protein
MLPVSQALVIGVNIGEFSPLSPELDSTSSLANLTLSLLGCPNTAKGCCWSVSIGKNSRGFVMNFRKGMQAERALFEM